MRIWRERFWPKVEIGDCWTWQGAKNSRGYGQFWNGEKVQYAHRFLWEQLVGPIPDGLTIDHLCQVKTCVNPDHLEVVDRATNWRRAVHANTRKQFCLKGHPLTVVRDQRGPDNAETVQRIVTVVFNFDRVDPTGTRGRYERLAEAILKALDGETP